MVPGAPVSSLPSLDAKKANSATTRTDCDDECRKCREAHIYRPFNAIGHGVFGFSGGSTL
jgi:hypothetical protein